MYVEVAVMGVLLAKEAHVGRTKERVERRTAENILTAYGMK